MSGARALIPVEIPAHDLVAQYELDPRRGHRGDPGRARERRVRARRGAVEIRGRVRASLRRRPRDRRRHRARRALHRPDARSASARGRGDHGRQHRHLHAAPRSATAARGSSSPTSTSRRSTSTRPPSRPPSRRSTAAIVAVHLYGLPADVARLREIADRHGLALIEDAALAFGATVDGQPVGGLGRIGCFSFAPHKILGAYGDGGMITTNDDELARRARLLAGYGEPWRESMAGPDGRLTLLAEGYHTHLDLLQAAVLRVKLRHAEDWITAAARERRRSTTNCSQTRRSSRLGPARPNARLPELRRPRPRARRGARRARPRRESRLRSSTSRRCTSSPSTSASATGRAHCRQRRRQRRSCSACPSTQSSRRAPCAASPASSGGPPNDHDRPKE